MCTTGWQGTAEKHPMNGGLSVYPPLGPFPFWAMIGVAGTMGALETCHDARIECLPAVKILSGDRAPGLDAVCEGIRLFENSVRSNH